MKLVSILFVFIYLFLFFLFLISFNFFFFFSKNFLSTVLQQFLLYITYTSVVLYIFVDVYICYMLSCTVLLFAVVH